MTSTDAAPHFLLLYDGMARVVDAASWFDDEFFEILKDCDCVSEAVTELHAALIDLDGIMDWIEREGEDWDVDTLRD